MRLFGYQLSFAKAVPVSARPANLSGVDGGGLWTRLWGHDFQGHLGSWQQDVEVNRDSVMAQATVFSCITLIASDIAKLRLRVVQQYGRVWLEKTTVGYSELLNKPNAYQTRQQFIEQWIISKLSNGNTYVLKDRDRKTRRVTAMYVLDPCRVTPLVAPDGAVYYQLQEDDLARVTETLPAVPASEVIHDRFNCLFHPLVGLSPIFASGLAAMQALQIQQNSAKFFKNQSRPSGILTAPTKIGDEAARRIKDYWEANYQGANKIGSVAVLGDGLTYTPNGTNAVDAQLVEQLKISAEQVCSTFHVPAYMVGAAPAPAYNNIEALNQQYYNQCLQALIEAAEVCLDYGIGFDEQIEVKANEKVTLGTDFRIGDLLRMDTATRVKALNDAVGGGWMKPNEARAESDMLPVEGGDTPYLQQQNFALAALSKRDSSDDPFGKASTSSPAPAPSPGPTAPDAAKIADDALRIAREIELQLVVQRAERAEQLARDSETASNAKAVALADGLLQRLMAPVGARD